MEFPSFPNQFLRDTVAEAMRSDPCDHFMAQTRHSYKTSGDCCSSWEYHAANHHENGDATDKHGKLHTFTVALRGRSNPVQSSSKNLPNIFKI